MDDEIDLLMKGLREQWPDLDVTSIALAGRIARLSIHLGEIAAAVFVPEGISLGESDVLAALWRTGPPYELSPSRLLASVTISSGGMTGRLDRLEHAGLVTRRPDPDDRRGVLVRLTDEGERLTAQLIHNYLTEQSRFLSVLTPAEAERLERSLRKLMHAARDSQRGNAETDGRGVAPAATSRRRSRR
ncbi:MAG: MarR family transcriptional regulator [Candidatus Dormibacteraeota bacterium]|nr:MarR family transcriptional regulator [Candidatus Dormibacteraeota bacterium]